MYLVLDIYTCLFIELSLSVMNCYSIYLTLNWLVSDKPYGFMFSSSLLMITNNHKNAASDSVSLIMQSG